MTRAPASPRFVLTGPSGWIGRAMLAQLAADRDGPLADHVLAFGSSARNMIAPNGETLPVRDLANITPEDIAGAHVIHLAYLTRERVDELGDDAFSAANLAIDDALLAALRGARPASLFVASSGAAAQAEQGLDLHPYAMAKLRQETGFLEWGQDAGVPVIAGRIFNIAGPFINKLRSYAISDFALQAREQGAIRIRAQVPVFRSYLHVADLCALAIDAALKGIGRDRPIDLCGAEVVEMEDLAAAVAAVSPNSPTISRGSVDHSRPSIYLGTHAETKTLAMELGNKLQSLRVQIVDVCTWLDTVVPLPQHQQATHTPRSLGTRPDKENHDNTDLYNKNVAPV